MKFLTHPQRYPSDLQSTLKQLPVSFGIPFKTTNRSRCQNYYIKCYLIFFHWESFHRRHRPFAPRQDENDACQNTGFNNKGVFKVASIIHEFKVASDVTQGDRLV